ncbi:sigma 54-interacting transcriptional regulator [Pseudobacillus sp. FSL P4-0506]|uniref:sigma-54 interaction domain-containing protein n=1 Tax=unclassified Pseudobacillus TaxID=2619284 RepID=UPI0030F85A4C
MLTLETCLTIMEQIEGLVIVDDQARIMFMTKRLAEDVGINRDQVIGKHILDVIPTSKIHQAVQMREPSIADFYFLKHTTIVSSRFPYYEGDRFAGVVEYDLFDNYQLLKNFIKKIDSLPTELSFFKQEQKRLKGNKYSIENIVGDSPQMKKLRKEIVNAAHSNSTVLITGETGTGKELVAHSIHALSKRSQGHFVSLNCSAIPLELFESELFGYEEGSFTNARKGGKMGKFQLASKGTLFLDEINQMPLALQPKILRTLQEKEIDRIGGKHSIPIDTRILCATNQDLRDLIKKGKFREDLFYRLNVFHIRIPPLRERKEDIPALVQLCIENLNHFLSRNVESASSEVLDILQQYDWPGNVRELQNTLERAMNSIDTNTHQLDAQHFESFIEENLSSRQEPLIPQSAEKPLEEVKKRAEKEAIIQVLKKCNGNRTKAAQVLKISRPLLYQKIKRLGIDLSKI